jgi:hypothetical protein
MPDIRKQKKRRKTKFNKITFKLSAKQKKSLDNYCKARRTTPTRLIKKSISRFINGFDMNVPQDYFITEKQLDLFIDHRIEEGEIKKAK